MFNWAPEIAFAVSGVRFFVSKFICKFKSVFEKIVILMKLS